MVIQIAKDVFSVGVKDWNRRLFDALIPLPQGTSYNSYLVKGHTKSALIDTVNPGFEKELIHNISSVMDLKDLNFLVMNHAEPDHAGSIPVILEKTNATLITTKKGAELAKLYYGVSDDRITIVKEGDELNLGDKSIKFIEAPWLHWPETMFTYLIEDKILFPCDFFGSHTASGIFDGDTEDLHSMAKKYFGEIMMPFKAMGKAAIEKLKNYEINIIAPSHGPIYKNPEAIIKEYKKWTAGETKEKVIILYTTMWNSTEKMVDSIMKSLMMQGTEVARYNLTHADIGDIAKDLVDSRGIVLGAPTVIGSLHPLALYGLQLVNTLKPPLKYGVVLNSYGWGKGALGKALELIPKTIEPVAALEINGPPRDLKQLEEIGVKLAQKIKQG
jgi:flavorubredoxin